MYIIYNILVTTCLTLRYVNQYVHIIIYFQENYGIELKEFFIKHRDGSVWKYKMKVADQV